MDEVVRHRHEVYCAIVQELANRGFIEPTHLTPRGKFSETYPAFTEWLQHPDVLAFADALLEAHPECQTTIKHFLPWFVLEILQAMDKPYSLPTARDLLTGVGGGGEALTILGMVALMIYQQKFGVPTLPKSTLRGLVEVVGKDGARYKALHDDGSYARYKSSLIGQLDLTPP